MHMTRSAPPSVEQSTINNNISNLSDLAKKSETNRHRIRVWTMRLPFWFGEKSTCFLTLFIIFKQPSFSLNSRKGFLELDPPFNYCPIYHVAQRPTTLATTSFQTGAIVSFLPLESPKALRSPSARWVNEQKKSVTRWAPRTPCKGQLDDWKLNSVNYLNMSIDQIIIRGS